MSTCEGQIRILLVPSGNKLATFERCREALRVWNSGQYDLMILSGGTAPNASEMFAWIIQQPNHPSKNHIIVENRSLDTYQNIYFSLRRVFVRYPNAQIDLFGVVTDSLHGLRCKITLQRGYNIANVVVHATPNSFLPHNRFLEWCYIIIHWLDPLGSNWLARLNRHSRSLARSSILTSQPGDHSG